MEGIYFFRVNKEIKNNSKFCFRDYEKVYTVFKTSPANLPKKFHLPKNSKISFNNNSYSDMAAFELTLFVDSLGTVKLFPGADP
ncbi:MAG: hypothetical protein BGP13_23010 [Sphingobacteriales bacterium 40-81]|nr:MAG: hypothetical protein BGP13_23010 [Sphingobacteriales bacterium 40-81]